MSTIQWQLKSNDQKILRKLSWHRIFWSEETPFFPKNKSEEKVVVRKHDIVFRYCVTFQGNKWYLYQSQSCFPKPRLKTIWFFYNYFCQLKFKSFRLKSGARRSLQEGQGFVCSSSFCRDKTVFIQTKNMPTATVYSYLLLRLQDITTNSQWKNWMKMKW